MKIPLCWLSSPAGIPRECKLVNCSQSFQGGLCCIYLLFYLALFKMTHFEWGCFSVSRSSRLARISQTGGWAWGWLAGRPAIHFGIVLHCEVPDALLEKDCINWKQYIILRKAEVLYFYSFLAHSTSKLSKNEQGNVQLGRTEATNKQGETAYMYTTRAKSFYLV